MLRAARHSLRRQLWLLRPSHYEATYPANCGRRRPFSDTSNTSSPPPTSPISRIQLEIFMGYALNTPLGIMKDEQWDDAVSAMECWLQLEGQGGGYAIDSGERILQRLIYEHAVGDPKSRFYIQRTKTLHMAQKALLHRWLDVSARNEKSRMALERSEKALTRLLEWRVRGWASSEEGEEEVFPIQEFLALVNGWLGLETANGSTHAANLLLAGTDEGKHLIIANAAFELIPCFQKAVKQCIEIIQDDDAETETSYDSAIALFDRMDFLSDQAGWEDMSTEVARKAMLENSIFGDEEGSLQRKKSISSFEIEELKKINQKRIIELVSGEADIQKVDRLIEKLAGAMPTAKLCTALTDYFARIGDAERATQWLQYLDQVTMANMGKRTELSTERFHRVLTAWSRSDTSRAAWRADELVRRMDGLESTQTTAIVVDAETYEILFSIWLESGDPVAHRKVREGFSRLLRMEKKTSAKTFKLALQASSHEATRPEVEAIYDSLLKQWSTFKQEDLLELFETIMESLAEQGAPAPFVQRLLQKAMDDRISFTKSICLYSLQAIKHTSRSPAETMDLLAFLGQSNVKFDLSCYQAAVQSLLKFEKNSSNGIKYVLSRSFPLVTDTILAQPPEQFGYMLQDILAVFTARKMYGAAEEFLMEAEHALLEQSPKDGALSPIPIACYQRMMKRKWYTKANAPKVMDTFNRLLAFYNTGYTNLRPDREIFESYIKSAAQIVEGPKEVEKILDDMVVLFETTGDEECKPDVDIFCTVLLAWQQEAGETDKAGKISLTLLERMLDLGVQPDMFTINLVMHNVIKSRKEDTYTTISDLFESMKSFGLEPDSYSLHYLLDACGPAKEGQRQAALRTCLQTLHLIRNQQNGAETITYGMLTKVLRRLLPKGLRADKIAGSTFILCCEDGLLDSELKEHFKTLMSHDAWQQAYTSRLHAEEEEPSEWSRRLVA
jgi:hypothetical protein